MNTTAGSYSLLNSIVPDDAGVVKKLRQAGAIMLGELRLSLINALFMMPMSVKRARPASRSGRIIEETLHMAGRHGAGRQRAHTIPKLILLVRHQARESLLLSVLLRSRLGMCLFLVVPSPLTTSHVARRRMAASHTLLPITTSLASSPPWASHPVRVVRYLSLIITTDVV